MSMLHSQGTRCYSAQHQRIFSRAAGKSWLHCSIKVIKCAKLLSQEGKQAGHRRTYSTSCASNSNRGGSNGAPGEGGSNGISKAETESMDTNGSACRDLTGSASKPDQPLRSAGDDGGGGSAGGGNNSRHGYGGGGDDDDDSDPRKSSWDQYSASLAKSVFGALWHPRTLFLLILYTLYTHIGKGDQLSTQDIAQSEAREAEEQPLEDLDLFWEPDTLDKTIAGAGALQRGKESDRGSSLERLKRWISAAFGRTELNNLNDKTVRLRSDICALKRLQRDAFEQMLGMSERIDTLEEEMGTSAPISSAGATLLGKPQSRGRARNRCQTPVQVSGMLTLGGEVCELQRGGGTIDPEPSVFSGAPQGGPQLQVNLNAPAYDSNTSVLAELRLSSSAERPILHKVLYRWRCAERLKLLLAMLNGRGDDFAPTLNPSAGRGVMALMRLGCPLHHRAQGEGFGVVYKGENYMISGAYLSSQGDDAGGASTTSLVQVYCAPSQQLALGLVALRQACSVAPAQQLAEEESLSSERVAAEAASSSSAQASRAQPSGRRRWGLLSLGHVLGGAGSDMQQHESLGVTGAWRSRYDEYAVNGWLAVNGLGDTRRSKDWGLTVSSIPSPDEDGWGLSIGQSSWTCQTGGGVPLLLEASLQLNAGDGLQLTPSLLCVRSSDSLTASLAFQSTVSF